MSVCQISSFFATLCSKVKVYYTFFTPFILYFIRLFFILFSVSKCLTICSLRNSLYRSITYVNKPFFLNEILILPFRYIFSVLSRFWLRNEDISLLFEHVYMPSVLFTSTDIKTDKYILKKTN